MHAPWSGYKVRQQTFASLFASSSLMESIFVHGVSLRCLRELSASLDPIEPQDRLQLLCFCNVVLTRKWRRHPPATFLMFLHLKQVVCRYVDGSATVFNVVARRSTSSIRPPRPSKVRALCLIHLKPLLRLKFRIFVGCLDDGSGSHLSCSYLSCSCRTYGRCNKNSLAVPTQCSRGARARVSREVQELVRENLELRKAILHLQQQATANWRNSQCTLRTHRALVSSLVEKCNEKDMLLEDSLHASRVQEGLSTARLPRLCTWVICLLRKSRPGGTTASVGPGLLSSWQNSTRSVSLATAPRVRSWGCL